MDNHLVLIVQEAAGVLGGILMMVALLVLWLRWRSPWLLLALAGEIVSWLFRLSFVVIPGMLSGMPAIMMVWQATGLMVAAGLLGFAFEQQPSRSA